MKKASLAGLIALPLSAAVAKYASGATVAFQDNMNRATFDASHNGWVVQSYAKGKGSFGLIPAAVNGNTNFRYSVNINSVGVASQSNTVTSAAYALPTAGQYLDFSANLNIDSTSAATPGLVFAISAFGQDASNNEWATNFEFVTKQLNAGNPVVPNDVISLTSFNNFTSAKPANEWSSNVASGVDPTVGFHTYTMRLFTNEVDYLVDNKVIATTTTDVPNGHSLSFELNAWAPDSSWTSAEAPLPNNSAFHMDVDWGKVTYGAVGVPVWTGAVTGDPLVLKEINNWTNGSPAAGNEAVIDSSAAVPATLYFGNAGTVGVTQILGALTINSSTLTAINANAQPSPISTSYAVTFTGNTGNTVPLISLGTNVAQGISISDSINSILKLQIGTTGGSINVSNATASLTINSAVTNATGITAAFDKIGNGLLVLNNAANSFGGIGQTITISGGTLSVNADGELGNSANTITLNGGALLANPASPLTLVRSVAVGAAGGTIALPNSSVIFSGAFSGNGLLTKTGAGELILNNSAGSYSGTIAVSAGNFRLIDPRSVAEGTVVQLIGSGSTLNLRTNADASYPVNIEALTKPVQIFVAPADSGFNGHTLSVGTIKIGATTLSIGGNTGYAAQSGAVTMSGNATMTINTAAMTIASIGETGGSRSFTKNGPNRLIVDGAATYTGSTNVTAGTLEIGSSLTSNAVTVAVGATLAVDSGATLASASVIGDNGTITVASSTDSTIRPMTLQSLNLGYNGTVAGNFALAPGTSSASRTVLNIIGNGSTSGLVFAGSANNWHGQLDLASNDLIVKNGSLSNIANQLQFGFKGDGGYWNGAAGIVSSSAATDTRFLTTVGYRTGGSLFDGVNTTSSDVLLKYTYYGDADLNGVVDGADYQQIDLGFGAGGTDWSNGDFNYDGVVNGSDFALIDNTFNQLTASSADSLVAIAGPAAITDASTSSVPEPSALGIFGAIAFATILRRRRVR